MNGGENHYTQCISKICKCKKFWNHRNRKKIENDCMYKIL